MSKYLDDERRFEAETLALISGDLIVRNGALIRPRLPFRSKPDERQFFPVEYATEGDGFRFRGDAVVHSASAVPPIAGWAFGKPGGLRLFLNPEKGGREVRRRFMEPDVAEDREARSRAMRLVAARDSKRFDEIESEHADGQLDAIIAYRRGDRDHHHGEGGASWISIRVAAEMLGCSERAVLRMIADDELPDVGWVAGSEPIIGTKLDAVQRRLATE